jgi:hypothetical protein
LALNDISGDNGRLFLEKISAKPNLRRNDLLISGLHDSPIIFAIFAKYIASFQSFGFAVSAFSGNGVLEVNPIDLLCMETFRIAEPEVYEAIRKNKFILVHRARSDRREECGELAEILLAASEQPKECAPINPEAVIPRTLKTLGEFFLF